MVRNKFMGVSFTMMASTLQSQKDEMDKQISPHKLRLTSPNYVERFFTTNNNHDKWFLNNPTFAPKFQLPPARHQQHGQSFLMLEVRDGILSLLLLLLRSHSLPSILQPNTKMSLNLVYKYCLQLDVNWCPQFYVNDLPQHAVPYKVQE